jgi:hypothetical protein
MQNLFIALSILDTENIKQAFLFVKNKRKGQEIRARLPWIDFKRSCCIVANLVAKLLPCIHQSQLSESID